MSSNLVSDRPAAISVLSLFAMLLVGYIIIGNVVALVVISLFYQGNFMEAMTDPVGHPDIRNIMVVAQGLASLAGLVFIPTFYLKKIESRSINRFFTGFPAGKWFLVLSLSVVALAIAVSPIADWNATVHFPSWTGGLENFLRGFEDQAAKLVRAFVSDLSPGEFLMVFVVIAIIPALGEELVFRGFIQTELVRAFRNPHVGIWFAAAFFSAFHLQFFGFFPRLFMGATMGYLYHWSRNLWIPITYHFLNNGIQVTAIYLAQLELHSYDVESTESAPLLAVVISLLMLVGLLYYCKKNLAPVPDDRTVSELQ